MRSSPCADPAEAPVLAVAAAPARSFSGCAPLMLVPATWSTPREAIVPGGLPGVPSGAPTPAAPGIAAVPVR
jgi:hypothetical protein